MFSIIFYEQPLLHTTVIETRHDGSKVTVHWHEMVNFRVQYANLPMRIEAYKFRLASVNRTSDPGPTSINWSPGSEALVWTWPKFDLISTTVAEAAEEIVLRVRRLRKYLKETKGLDKERTERSRKQNCKR